MSRVALAAIAGAHGIKGEVRLKLFAESADSLAAHDRLYVGGRPLRLVSIRAGKAPVARFEGIADRSAAEGLRGQLVEVDRAALPPLDDGEYYHADLIGLTCFSEEGETIGSQVSVILVYSKRDGAGPRLHQHPYTETFIIRKGRAGKRSAEVRRPRVRSELEPLAQGR